MVVGGSSYVTNKFGRYYTICGQASGVQRWTGVHTVKPVGVWEFDQRRRMDGGKAEGGAGMRVLWWTQVGLRREMWRAVVAHGFVSRGWGCSGCDCGARRGGR